MTITKFGHSCLLIEQAGARILIDPGVFSSVPAALTGINTILLTHEHPDHTDVTSLQVLLHNNPAAVIHTNAGVGVVLSKASIPFTLFEDGQSVDVSGVKVEGLGKLHETILASTPPVANTGFLIADRLFVPGDAFTQLNRQVELLALPVAAPWCKLAETLQYTAALKPKVVIPIHDGFLTPKNPYLFWLENELPKQGIDVRVLNIGEATEF